MAKVNFLNQESHLCQKDTFLSFMVIHIRKPENEGTLFRENEKKNSGKDLNKIEARFAEEATSLISQIVFFIL